MWTLLQNTQGHYINIQCICITVHKCYKTCIYDCVCVCVCVCVCAHVCVRVWQQVMLLNTVCFVQAGAAKPEKRAAASFA